MIKSKNKVILKTGKVMFRTTAFVFRIHPDTFRTGTNILRKSALIPRTNIFFLYLRKNSHT